MSNLNDPEAVGQFMVTAGTVAEKLKHKYKKQWINPLAEKSDKLYNTDKQDEPVDEAKAAQDFAANTLN